MNTIHCDKVEIMQLKHWKRKNRKEEDILFKMKIGKKLFIYIYSISVYIKDRQTTGKPDSKKRNRKTGSESALRNKYKNHH